MLKKKLQNATIKTVLSTETQQGKQNNYAYLNKQACSNADHIGRAV
jgi:hypothetical protein